MSATMKPTPSVNEVDLNHLDFDSTNKTDYQVKEARIRSTECYVTAGLLAEMEERWGGSFTAVRTITDTKAKKVYLFPAGSKETDVVAVRKSETLASATFSFAIPLQKLELKLRKDRQIVVVPQPVAVTGRGEAYCLNLAGVRATKRPRSESEGSPTEEKQTGETPATAKAAPEAVQVKAKSRKSNSVDANDQSAG
jgi:hypothetical protein